jgi:hypothetical protein
METIRQVMLVVFLSLFVTNFVGAMMQEPATPAAPASEAPSDGGEKKPFDINNLWQMALAGALGTAFLGAGKKGEFNPKSWDMKKMIQKAIVGLVIGIFASLKGIDLDSAQVAFAEGDGLALAAMLVFGLDYLFRTVWKGAAISVRNLVDNFKKAGGSSENPPSTPPRS